MIDQQIKQYDNSIYECFNQPDIEGLSNKSIEEQKEIHNNESIMLIGQAAGMTLEQYFNKVMVNIEDMNIYILEHKFLDVMDKLKYIFIGLHQLRDYGISHLDVKPNNIVLDGDYFKFIDFGISAQFSDLKSFKERAINESKSDRLYLWYPSEFLFSQI